MTASAPGGRRVVISQPMLFPWVGMLEQVRLADVYVHYDDVPFSKGSFTNRVQAKTAGGPRWLTIPLQDLRLGQLIRDVRAAASDGWRNRHLGLLEQAYRGATYQEDMLAMVRRVYDLRTDLLGEIVMASMQQLWAYFDLTPASVLVSSALGIPGKGSPRVLALVRHLGGTVYVTGHGGRAYLEHEAFAAAGVDVQYMDYARTPYPQRHGPFTASVSGLDLVASLGREGRRVIASGTVPWRQFLLRASDAKTPGNP
jgi:hypothetical protein